MMSAAISIRRLRCVIPGACLWLLWVLLSASTAHAATPADLAVEAQNPAPTNAIEIDAGYGFSFRSSEENQSFSRVTYHGQMVQSTGTPFKYARGIDLLAPAVPEGTGDRNKLTLRFENGTTTVGGSLLQAEGVQPLALRGLEKLQLRGTGLVGADPEHGDVTYAVGLESPPLRIPGLAGSQASNWLVFGINGQRQETDEDGSETANSGLLTYRSFVGKAFGWRKSAAVGPTAEKISTVFLGQAPTYAQAQALGADVYKIHANQRTELQQLFLRAVGDADVWESVVQEAALEQAKGDTKAAEAIATEVLGQAATLAEAQQLSGQLGQIPAEQRTPAQQVILAAMPVAQTRDEANWPKTVRDIALGYADAITDQPTVSAYVEASGWYTFSGDQQGARLKNLLTATLDYWFLPTRDDVFLRIRYENGYERALPTDRRNHLLVSLALRF